MSRSRRSSTPFNIERLEKRHQRLKQKVAEYEERLALTSGEEMQLQKLKKQKLRTKDELNAIKA